jgi:hypothetical protein
MEIKINTHAIIFGVDRFPVLFCNNFNVIDVAYTSQNIFKINKSKIIIKIKMKNTAA